ncbi:MAG TPA: hypothetical protein VNM37_23110 [Candidatus Dormibacteraeota bacterium]|nr:hypothetical protein [Candidatus Dormibacteraeota bacterium]
MKFIATEAVRSWGTFLSKNRFLRLKIESEGRRSNPAGAIPFCVFDQGGRLARLGQLGSASVVALVALDISKPGY